MFELNVVRYIGCGSCNGIDLADDAAVVAYGRARWTRGYLERSSSFSRKGACAADCAALQETEVLSRGKILY